VPNPNGNLAGWSDPSAPGWQERAVSRVIARQRVTKPRNGSRRRGVLQVFWDPEFSVLLDEAAERRGMTAASYARRAVATWVARDLGIPVQAILRYCAAVTPYGVPAPGGRRAPGERTIDDGTGYGEWTM
jgi:hypothetical protein